MKNIHGVSSQLFAYLRVISFSIVVIIMVFAGIKGSALGFAPHTPDIALDVEIQHHREQTEKYRDQKASEKVDKYKHHKEEKKKAPPKQKKPKEKKHGHKTKTPKPPKPSKAEKKKAAKHRARTLN